MIVRVDGDHRVMRRAPSERARPRVPDSILFPSELVVALLLLVVGIVPDEIIPSHRLEFACRAVECRHLVIGGGAEIAPSFEKQYAEAPLRQVARQGPP